jgi:gluconolactonase
MTAEHLEILNYKRFRPYVIAHAKLELLHSGMRWAEGPVWFADLECLLWVDIPNDRIMRWVEGQPATIYRAPSNNANGMTRDRQGRLVVCEHGGRRVTRTEPDGTITVLADRFEGKRLNSPNDVVVKSDDSVWFTDPDYGLLTDYTGRKAQREIGANNVYRLDPRTGRLTVATGELVKPNGLAFSPDERILYIADSGASHDPQGPHHIVAYDVADEGKLCNRRVLAVVSPGIPDGFRVDVDGNIWTSAADGVHCIAADGELVGKIRVPDTVANVAFGGTRRNRLFIAAAGSLYALFLATSGAQRP